MALNRDNNRKPIGGAISIADLITVTPLQVDPVTNRLLIDVTIDTNASSILPTKDKHDANRVPTGYGINATDLTTPLPLLIDHNNQYLFVDITT